MTNPSDEPEPPDVRQLLLAVGVSLAFGLVASLAVAAIREPAFVIFFLLVLVFFWGWVGLGTVVGLFTAKALLGAPEPWQSRIAAAVAVVASGLTLFFGGHDLVLHEIRLLGRFNVDLAGYYLVWLQLLYFGLALVLALISLATLLLFARFR